MYGYARVLWLAAIVAGLVCADVRLASAQTKDSVSDSPWYGRSCRCTGAQYEPSAKDPERAAGLSFACQ